MHGAIRTLVHPPVSSREAFAELDARKAEAIVDDPAEGTSRDAVWLRPIGTSIEVEPSAVDGSAIVWLWHDITNVKGERKVIDYIRIDAEDLARFGAGVVALARRIVVKQQNAAQAALEQDCDRREEIQRLGHES